MARIVLDATLVGGRTKGAGRALRNLLAELPRVAPEHEFVALATRTGADELAEADAEVVVVDVGRGLEWELRGVGAAAAAAGADVLFTVRELSPLGGPATVVHVYEPPLWRLRSPELRSVDGVKSAAKDALLHLALGRSLRRAAAVTAGSATTADWLRKHARVGAEIVYPGVDPVFLEEQGASAASVPPYFLHPATGDRRENTRLVLDAFAAADRPDAVLRLVGLPEHLRDEIAAAAASRGIADRVEPLGWVSDERLRELYRDAVALIHPTRYESFAGLPALEAMALGTPVVALDAPGSTEGLQGAAVLLEREDATLLARELRRLERDEAARSELARAGQERARRLTWRESARALAVVLTRVAA